MEVVVTSNSTRNPIPAHLRLPALAVVAAALLCGGFAVSIHVDPVAAASSGGFEAADFAGTWNWMFNDKVFATMTLGRNRDQFSGSITNSSIDLDGDGKIASASSAPGAAVIVQTFLEGETLHILAKDGGETVEYLVTLKSPEVAEVKFTGPDVPASFPIIRAEKAR